MSKCLSVHLTSNMVNLVSDYYGKSSGDHKAVKLSSVIRKLLKQSLDKIDIQEGKELQLSFESKTDNSGIQPIMLLISQEIDAKLEDIRQYVPLSKKKLAEYLIQLEVAGLGKKG